MQLNSLRYYIDRKGFIIKNVTELFELRYKTDAGGSPNKASESGSLIDASPNISKHCLEGKDTP